MEKFDLDIFAWRKERVSKGESVEVPVVWKGIE